MSEQRAILAGGCFWGMQDLIRRYDGVISTRVGDSGVDVPRATYRDYGTHAEAIEIVFDPERTSLTPLGITVGTLPVNAGASGLAA